MFANNIFCKLGYFYDGFHYILTVAQTKLVHSGNIARL